MTPKGTPERRTIGIHCLKCRTLLYRYRKGGTGGLVKCYLDRIAEDLGLCGWVKNLPNGNVELVAEGKEGDLKQLLERLDKHFAHYIADKQISWMPARGEFNSFDIKFW